MVLDPCKDFKIAATTSTTEMWITVCRFEQFELGKREKALYTEIGLNGLSLLYLYIIHFLSAFQWKRTRIFLFCFRFYAKWRL